MEQHPVPQNVTTFQFRLIGDMTLKQFGYLASGVLLGYIFLKLPLPLFLNYPLGILFGLLGFGFAFVPIEERPMDVWALSFFKSIYSPTQYVWQKAQPIPEPKEAATTVAPNPLPLQKTAALTAVTPPMVAHPPQPAPMAQPKVVAPPVIQAPPPVQQLVHPQVIAAQVPAPNVPFHHEVPPIAPHGTVALPHNVMKPKTPVALRKKNWLFAWISQLFAPHPKPTVSHPVHKEASANTPPPSPVPTLRPQQVVPELQVRAHQSAPTPMLAPVAQSQQPRPPVAKRKNWFEILFGSKPPRQEKPIIQAQNFPDVFANIKTPAITGHRQQIPTVSQAAPPMQPIVPTEVKPPMPTDTKVKDLEGKLEVLQKELHTKSISDDRILELQKQLTDVLSERQKMEHELQFLRQSMAKSQATPVRQPVVQPMAMQSPTVTAQPTVRIFSPEGAIKAGLPRLTSIPNVVTGLIKDHEGTLLPGVLVTVRDQHDVPMRALKTNKLGQFAASTPLPNGVYIVEVEDPRTRFAFDRIQISLNGSVIPALEIVAKSQKELTRAKLEKEIFGANVQ